MSPHFVFDEGHLLDKIYLGMWIGRSGHSVAAKSPDFLLWGSVKEAVRVFPVTNSIEALKILIKLWMDTTNGRGYA